MKRLFLEYALSTEYKKYIFGAGYQGLQIKKFLLGHGWDVEAFIDNNAEKQNTKIEDMRCISLQEAINESGTDMVVIVSPVDSTDIIIQLLQSGVKKIYRAEDILQHTHSFPFIKEEKDYCYIRPFNHYESPYPDISEIHRNEKTIFDENKTVLEIDFNIEHQLELLNQMKAFSILDWENDKNYRYVKGDNGWFNADSACGLYYMLRVIQPNKVIEVGSGFSTAVMLDTNNACFNNQIEIISIEPNAERLKSLLKDEDNLLIHECNLQEIPVSFFEQLEEGDILFVDSSHVSKIDSDVNYVLFEILPRLKKGVYIHFHDIFYPFIYPKQWIYNGRAYNEMYLLRAFLMNNKNYSIQFWGDMLVKKFPELTKSMEIAAESLWIRKELE